MKRGLRQGCPLSPYLFIICVEILATVIRAKKNIKGIRVGNQDCKISQYADDSTLISDGSRQSLHNIFSVLDTFASVSGLKVNYEKTEAIWIGALKDSTNTMFPEKKIKWSIDKVKALGVWFSAKNKNINSINYREKK